MRNAYNRLPAVLPEAVLHQRMRGLVTRASVDAILHGVYKESGHSPVAHDGCKSHPALLNKARWCNRQTRPPQKRFECGFDAHPCHHGFWEPDLLLSMTARKDGQPSRVHDRGGQMCEAWFESASSMVRLLTAQVQHHISRGGFICGRSATEAQRGSARRCARGAMRIATGI